MLGRPIAVLPQDNRTGPAQAVAAARVLDSQGKVLTLSGPTSSDTALAVYGYGEQNTVPFVVPVAAFPRLTRPGTQWTFRVDPDVGGWGCAIGKFVEKQKPGGTLFAMAYSFDLTAAWSMAIVAFAIRIVGGPGSVLGSVVIGLVFGFTQAIVSVFANPTIATFSSLVAMLIILLVKPSGLFTR